MGIVTDYLIELVHKNLKNHGIVIWYDPEKQYYTVVEKLVNDIPTFFYDGSYFEIWDKLEPYLDAKEREKVLVYIPEKHDEIASPLIEAECYGIFIKPGGPTGRNTRLEILARNSLLEIFNQEEIAEFEEKITEGHLKLEDLDKLAEKGKGIAKAGAVSLIFNTNDPMDIALQFLSCDVNDQNIKEKDALKEMMVLIESHFGIEGSTEKVYEYKEMLTRYALISEFTSSLAEGADISSLDSVPKAQKKGHVDACKKLVNTWRNRSDLKDNYVIAAEKVENDFDLASIEITPKNLIDIETFPWCEKALITYTIDLVLNGDFSKAIEIAESRTRKFWPKIDYNNSRMLWKIVSSSAILNNLAESIQNEMSVSYIGAKKIIEKYADYSNPSAWCRLDQINRHLELDYSDYYKAAIDEIPNLPLMITKANQTYYDTVNQMAEKFSDALIKDNFKLEGLMDQRQIFSKTVEPKLSQGKTAYFLVDALRYELAADLYDSLKVKERDIKFALATPPTITPVGMAALLPRANENFSIDPSTALLTCKINDTILKLREDRIKYLKETSPTEVVSFKLGELPKDSTVLKNRIKKADLVLITTREIDVHNIEGNRDLVHKIMVDVLEQIITAIRKLRDCNVQNIVITTDHGHLFGEKIGTDMRIDPPGGDTLFLDRRCWIGRGGSTSDSYFRVKPQVFGLDGDFEFAFPKSVGGFKAKGGGLSFLHGGLSLQEFIIPVIELVVESQKTETTEKGLNFRLKYGKEKVTNPFFTVEAEFNWKELLVGPENYRVRIDVNVENKHGKVISTSPDYGFDDITGEVTLNKDEISHITLMIPENIKKGKISIYMVDAETSKELAKIENLELFITI